MNTFNLYLCGVGGQGIGLLSEVLIQAVQLKGFPVIGADTHGLAQRGGTVSSHIRIGEKAKTPLVSIGTADGIIGLERLETLRAVGQMLQSGGTVLYYDAVYQPVHVRAFHAEYPGADKLESAVSARSGKLVRAFRQDLPEERMQNIVLLAEAGRIGLVPGIGTEEIRAALETVLPSRIRAANLELYEQCLST